MKIFLVLALTTAFLNSVAFGQDKALIADGTVEMPAKYALQPTVEKLLAPEKEAVKKAVEDAEDVQDVERARKRKRGPADSRSRAARISQPIVKGGARRSTFHRAAPRRLIGTIRASLHSRTCQ